jgi:hypothetical protein
VTTIRRNFVIFRCPRHIPFDTNALFKKTAVSNLTHQHTPGRRKSLENGMRAAQS